MTVAVRSPADEHLKLVVDEVMRRARIAFEAFRDVSQERADEAVRALAWSIYKPEHARELADRILDEAIALRRPQSVLDETTPSQLSARR